ncbi:MAG: 2Fe-2S iron-sulfur cluster binding domain-containing protein [Myxococcota bacterium]
MKIRFERAGEVRILECQPGETLRQALLRSGISPHNGTRAVSCHGLGTCGTCAVEIRESVTPPGAVERWRLGFPPHNLESGLRLACQVTPEQDLHVIKHDGFWGQQIPE